MVLFSTPIGVNMLAIAKKFGIIFLNSQKVGHDKRRVSPVAGTL
jgi:hypothetical protein